MLAGDCPDERIDTVITGDQDSLYIPDAPFKKFNTPMTPSDKAKHIYESSLPFGNMWLSILNAKKLFPIIVAETNAYAEAFFAKRKR